MLRGLRLFTPAAVCLLAACAVDADNVDADESALLPNGTVFDTEHDGASYRRIAEHFAGQGLEMHVSTDGFAPAWPLALSADHKTPVLNRVGTPVLYSDLGYYHTGMDVLRSDLTAGTEVLAPHDGLAVAFDWGGNKISRVSNAWATVVAIYDPVSHVVTQLMHVAADSAIVQSPTPVQVTKGSVIGKLASAPLRGADGSRLSNVQVVFIDGEQKKILNPAKYLVDYRDTVAPTASNVYVVDEEAAVHGEFLPGKIDLVVEASDRDDDSGRNLEVSAIEYTVKDQDGNLLASLPKCSLDNLYESVAEPASFRAKELIDFGSAKQQVSGAWPNSDVDNPFRTFRYALTQLAVVEGKCTVRDDADGFLDVGTSVTNLVVTVKLSDPKGNESETSFQLQRGTPPAAPTPGNEENNEP